MADRTLPELQKIFNDALKYGLDQGAEALIRAMTDKYNVDATSVDVLLDRWYPAQAGSGLAYIRLAKGLDVESNLPWYLRFAPNIEQGVTFEIKRGHQFTLRDAFMRDARSSHGLPTPFLRARPMMRFRKGFLPRGVTWRGGKRSGQLIPEQLMGHGTHHGQWREPIYKFVGPKLTMLIASKAMREVFYAAAVQAITQYFETQFK